MPRLLVNPGTPQQWEILLKPGTNTLGRSPACDGQIDHGSVSGTHCQIVVNGDTVAFKDLGSTNGTFLNHTPITEGMLTAGQRLQLGNIEMEYIADPPRSAGALPAPAPIRVSLAGSPVATTTVSSTAPRAPAPPPEPPKPRLHVATHEAPPPPPSVPETYVVDEYAQSTEAPATCKYHPKSVARYLCPQCQLNFCELCVASRGGGGRTGKYCRKCSTECVAINVQMIALEDKFANFFTSVPGAFAYPVAPKNWMFLLSGTMFFGVIGILESASSFFSPYAWYLRVVYTGYTFAYLQRVIHTAAQGSEEASSWPEISSWWDDIMVPFFQTVGLLLISFGPALGMLFWMGAEMKNTGAPQMWQLAGLGLSVLAGAVYYPMALLALAMFDSLMSANPAVVLPAIFRVRLEYLVVTVLTGLLIGVKYLGGFLSELVPVPAVPDLIVAAIGLYFLTVQGRLLGLMYYAKRDKLGWFGH